MRRRPKINSSTKYILSGLVPFTDANLKLAFKPNLFFNDLAKISGRKEATLRNEFYRLKAKGYFKVSDYKHIELSDKAILELQRYQPQQLTNAVLMVIFDIPEVERSKRNYLRITLRQLKFEQVQKSVWVTKYECRDYLNNEIKLNNLQQYIHIYESKLIS